MPKAKIIISLAPDKRRNEIGGLKGQLKRNPEYTHCHRISDKWKRTLKITFGV